MENFVQGLLNMNPEQMQAWIKEQAMYGPAPGQGGLPLQGQPIGQAPVPQPSQPPTQPFAAMLPAAPQGQGVSLPVTTNGVSAQQAPLSTILGGYNGY